MQVPLQSSPVQREPASAGARRPVSDSRGLVPSQLEECKQCCATCKTAYKNDPARRAACFQTCLEDYGGWCRCDLM